MPTYISEVPSKDYLLSRFYEKEGFIYWKPCKISRNRDSERAHRKINTYFDNGYYRVVISRKSYPLSRVVYQIHFGDLTPSYEVDHLDLDKTNNCISNLRKVRQAVNKRNKPKAKNNSSGFSGVCLNRKPHPAPNQHKITEYFVARWFDRSGVLKGKHFRIDKLGHDNAFRLACEYRAKMIEELNAQGMGYTERHGKPLDNTTQQML